ncbi:hypothetical protein M2132_001800 [Dysgonomonas sp. PH5-45]|uniref:hypothetical protein n=1 Tax=unclassified Dysgonomonas TaxID=2630389 RepID=UPI00247502BC|nr:MULTISPECIES: hypothetical protein [unclassified Dysgonomonas]MDH6355457.1 hypothetical protein [Dysgonomonas sp. PH5-45]MDH6388353.1 hypothetical protein [Dysgonomonas sp. PH5-37]
MKAITFDFGSNLGGLNKVYAIPPSSLIEIIHNYSKKQISLRLTGTSDIIEIYCILDTMQFTEEKTQPAAGPTYNPVITGITPKSNEINQEQLIRLESSYWLLLFEDNNGNTRLAGNEDLFLVFNRTESTGQTIQSRNQIQFTFSGFQSHPCYFIQDASLV